MKSFRFFWNTHKWTGLTLAAFFLCTAATGFLLIIKKKVDWIQPPTMQGSAGEPSEMITIERMTQVVLALNHPDFRAFGDIDRVDFRPGDRVFKVISLHNYAEVQVCAITGQVLRIDWRPSDLLEDIHDGSYWGDWVHDWIMPVVPVGLTFLVCSGIWLWIEPMVRRRRRRKRAAKATS